MDFSGDFNASCGLDDLEDISLLGEDDFPQASSPEAESVSLAEVPIQVAKKADQFNQKLALRQQELDLVYQENNSLLAALNAAKREAAIVAQQVEEKEKENLDLAEMNSSIKAGLLRKETKVEELYAEKEGLTGSKQSDEATLDAALKQRNEKIKALESELFDLENNPQNKEKDIEIARLETEIFASTEQANLVEIREHSLKSSLLKGLSGNKQDVLNLKVIKEKEQYVTLKKEVLEKRLAEIYAEIARNKPARDYNVPASDAVKVEIKKLRAANTILSKRCDKMERQSVVMAARLAEVRKAYDHKSSQLDITSQVQAEDLKRAALIQDVRALRTVVYDTKLGLKESLKANQKLMDMKFKIKELLDHYVECEEKNWKMTDEETAHAESLMDKSCNAGALRWCYTMAETF